MTRKPEPDSRRGRVSEEIVRQVQGWLRQGELKPGNQLPPERRLAGLFRASRGSVREALRALEVSGVIRSRQGGGNFVAERLPNAVTLPLAQFLDRQLERLRDLSEARQMFEPRLAFLAAERATRDDTQRMRKALEQQGRALPRGDTEAFSNADRFFHQEIAEATRNQTFIMLHNYLSDLISEIRRDAADSGPRREQALADHRAIYEAIARGDGPAAGAAMLQHVKTVEALLVDALLAYRGAVAPSEAGAEPESGRNAPLLLGTVPPGKAGQPLDFG